MTAKALIDAGTPTALDDATATRLGLKVYQHGTTYNGGNAPTVSGVNVTSVTRAVFIPYQMADGTWRMKLQLRVTSSAVQTNILNINGITTKNVTSWEQVVAMSQLGGASTPMSIAGFTPNSNTLTLAVTTTSTLWGVSGDIELESKPTWAY